MRCRSVGMGLEAFVVEGERSAKMREYEELLMFDYARTAQVTTVALNAADD